MRSSWLFLLFTAFHVFWISLSKAKTAADFLTGTNNLPLGLLKNSSAISQSSNRLNKLCSDPACQACDSCAFGKLKMELYQCKRAVGTLRRRLALNLNPLDISRECLFKTCYPIQRKQYCQLIKHDPKGNVIDELDEAIRLRNADLVKVKSNLQRLKAPHERSGLLEYGRKMEQVRKVMARQRVNVLRARSYNAKLKDYMESFEHRKVLQEVTRFKFENDDLRQHLQFWLNQNKTLFHAVTLSPRAVREARDVLHEKMLEYEADARLLEVMRKSSVTKETQVQLITDLKTEVRHQLEQTRTVNAQAKTEALFIEKAKQEIYSLLINVLKKMRQGKVSVTCGTSALGKSVQSELTS